MPTTIKNLAHLAECNIERLGDHRALFFEGSTYLASDLQRSAASVATALADLGVQPGDRVLVVLQNRPEVRIAYLACWRLGAVVTPLSILSAQRDVERALRAAEPTVVITESSALANVRASLRASTSTAHIVVVDHDETTEGAIPFAALTTQPARDLPYVGSDDLAALLFTGGTTGRSKGVMLSHENLWTAGASRADIWAGTPAAVSVMPLPLSHVFGLLVTVADLHWETPREQVLMRRFDARTCLSLIEERKATEACLVPAAIERVLDQPLDEFDLRSWTHVVSGSAPILRATQERFTTLLPCVELRMGYGLSEASGLVTGTRRSASVPGSVGTPAPDCELRVLGFEGGDAPPGTTGEIVCRSPFVMRGYWGEPELSEATVRDGWLHTGDIGYVDGGNLFIVGRSKDLIIRNGFNVFPTEVELALLEHPDIEEAVVVGRPDAQTGEEVVAFVTLGTDSTLDLVALRAFARQCVGAHKYPRDFHIVTNIPRTALGKIDRRTLRERLGSHE